MTQRSVLLSGLLFVIVSRQYGFSENNGPRTVVSESGMIFLAQIDSAEAGDGCSRLWAGRVNSWCDTMVRARIVHVYKGGEPAVSESVVFDGVIRQRLRSGSGGGPWETHEKPILPGQRFLIFAVAPGDMSTIFLKTSGPLLVSEDEDAIGDVELMLNSQFLALDQQASRVALAIENSWKARSHLLAQYAGQLLALGTDSETASLRQAVERSNADAFSARGRSEVLRQLAFESQNGTKGTDSLVHAFVTMTARYFLLEPYEATSMIPDLYSEILNGYMPAILRSARAKVLLRSALVPEVRRKLEKRAEDAASNQGLPPSRREQMSELVSLIKMP